jgi:hypothetical protein
MAFTNPFQNFRNNDPETSKTAGGAADRTAQMVKMLRAVSDAGHGLNAYEAGTAAGLDYPGSSYWTRFSEAKRKRPPLLEFTGEKRPGSTKQLQEVWDLTDAGRKFLVEHSR